MLPSNSNLTLYTNNTFYGLDVYTKRGPLIREHLEMAYQTLNRALDVYRRLLVVRVDLHYPANRPLPEDANRSAIVQRFIDSLTVRIEHNQSMALKQDKRVHYTEVRYIWAKEYGNTDGRPHYHMVLMFNRDAYAYLGEYDINKNNLYSRIAKAWASALNVPLEDMKGLVHIPDNAVHSLDSDYRKSSVFNDVLYRISYLCKLDTKHIGNSERPFGHSRK